MTDHEAETGNDQESNRDSKVDAIAAVVLILLAVAGVVYYVAHM